MTQPSLTRRQTLQNLALTTGAALTGSLLAPDRAQAQPAATASNFILCFNTGTIRGQKVGIVKELEIAAKAGYQAIEPWVEHIDQYAKSGGSLADLRKRAQDLGLTIESAIGFPEWIVNDDTRRAQGLERAKREMDLIAQVGGRRLAAPPAGATDLPLLNLDQAAQRYRALLDLGDSLGVIPQMEVWGFSKNVSTVASAAHIAIASGHPKACVLADVFHMYKGGSAFDGLRLLQGTALPVFHMNDYPAAPPRDQINDGYRIFPGDGVAPLKSILADLRAKGTTIVLSLELFNAEYYKQDALEVAKVGYAKMKAAIA